MTNWRLIAHSIGFGFFVGGLIAMVIISNPNINTSQTINPQLPHIGNTVNTTDPRNLIGAWSLNGTSNGLSVSALIVFGNDSLYNISGHVSNLPFSYNGTYELDNENKLLLLNNDRGAQTGYQLNTNLSSKVNSFSASNTYTKEYYTFTRKMR